MVTSPVRSGVDEEAGKEASDIHLEETAPWKASVRITDTNQVKLWHHNRNDTEGTRGFWCSSPESTSIKKMLGTPAEKSGETPVVVVSAGGEPCDDPPPGDEVANSKVTVIEFAETEVCDNEDGAGFTSCFGYTKTPMTFTVERRGFLGCAVEVKWHTENKSTSAWFYGNEDGDDLTGVVHFAAGETAKVIVVAFEDDPTYSSEATYLVTLTECKVLDYAKNGAMAVLGPLSQAMGCKLDRQLFPMNVGPKAGKLELYFGFVFEIFWMMPWKTLLSVLFNIVPALAFYVHQMIMEYAIDTISKKDDLTYPKTRARLEYAASFYLASWLVQFVAQLLNAALKLRGKATRELRVLVISQMIQLSPRAQEAFDTGDITNVMSSQVAGAIEKVFLTTLKMWCELCKFGVQIYLISVNIRAGPGRLILLLFLFFSYAVLVVLCTFAKQNSLSYSAMEYDDNTVVLTTMLESGRQVVTNYDLGWVFTKMFKQMHVVTSQKGFEAGYFELHTQLVLHWGTVVIGAYVIAHASLPREIDAGEFVVLFNSAVGMGLAAEGLASSVQILAIGLAAVEKVAQCLNAKTRRAEMLETRKVRNMQSDEDIVLSEAVLTTGKHTMGPISLVLRPGVIASLVDGPDKLLDGGAGKMSLLKMLNGDIVPTKGFLSVPQGYRTCLLPPFPVIFEGSLMFNLRICRPEATDKQIWSLCDDLGLSTRLQHQSEYDVGTEAIKISLSDQVIVAVARALLSGREAFFIGGTLDILTPPRVSKVLDALYCFLKNRGLDHWIPDPVPHFLRKRRSFLILTKSKQIADWTETNLILDPRVSTSEDLPHWDIHRKKTQ